MERTKNYDNFQFRIMDHPRGGVKDWSSGGTFHFINLLLEGEGWIEAEDMTLSLKKGDLYYLPMGLSYRIHWTKGPVSIRSMGFRIFPDANTNGFLMQKLPPEYIPESRQVPVNLQPDAYALGKFYTLLAKLVPHMQREGDSSGHRLVENAKKWMALMQMRHPVSHIAQRCGVSESTLYAAFREVEGKTPNAVRHEIVIAEAVRVLTESSTPIVTLSERLGFSSDTYFRKVIKDATGLSPRQIRKRGKL